MGLCSIFCLTLAADPRLRLGHGMRGLRVTVLAAASTNAAVTSTARQSSTQPVMTIRAVQLAKLKPMPKGRPGHINVRLNTHSLYFLPQATRLV